MLNKIIFCTVDVDVTGATETGVGAGAVFVLGHSYIVEMDVNLMNVAMSAITSVSAPSMLIFKIF